MNTLLGIILLVFVIISFLFTACWYYAGPDWGKSDRDKDKTHSWEEWQQKQKGKRR